MLLHHHGDLDGVENCLISLLSLSWLTLNVLRVCVCVCTLVDDEAVFRQVSSGDATGISSQQEQDFGWIVPDGVHTSLVTQV